MLEGLDVVDRGEGNVIDVAGVSKATKSSFVVVGNGNRVVFGKGCVLNGLSISIESDGNEVIVDDLARISGRFIMKIVPGNSIRIASGVSIGGANIICGEGSKVSIGRDSMLSFGIEIRTTDSHGIYDLVTGERVNSAADITVGDHVWLGAYAVLLGGAVIPSGCVLGIRSVVSNALDEKDAVYGGVPARLLRRGVRWERPLLG